MRLVFVAIGVCISASSASAAPMLVSDDDQKNILAICDIAAQSPSVTISREMRAGIAGYCLGWQRRIDAGNVPPPVTVPPAQQVPPDNTGPQP